MSSNICQADRVVKRLVPVALLTSVALAGCGDANSSNDASEVSQATTCSYPAAGEPSKPVDPPSGDDVANQGTVGATITLNGQDLAVELDRASAPCTVNNFVSLAEQGWFDGTDCHRLVDNGIFILQCGDPTGTGTGGPGYTIPDEVNTDLLEPYEGSDEAMVYPAGAVAMAKTMEPDSGGSQFFLVYADSPLPPDYTVFGTMDQAAVDMVAEIGAQGVDAGDMTTPIAEAHIDMVSLG